MKDVAYHAETRVRTNGIEIAYDSFGNPEAPPIILIMGFTMPMIAWDERFCEQLAGKDLRVIRFDNRDIGHSTWLTDAGVPNLHQLSLALMQGQSVVVPYKLQDMAKDILGLMDALQMESANIVGMSMGGMIAQTLAILHPERVRTLTSFSSSMWTMDPALPPPTPEALEVLMKPLPMDRNGFIAGSVKAWQVIGGPYMPLEEEMLRERARRFFERGVSLPGLARQRAAIMASGSRREMLKSLEIPTLVIHGDADPLVRPAHGVATAETIPGARLHMVKGMGHEVAPAAWSELIEAIAGHAM